MGNTFDVRVVSEVVDTYKRAIGIMAGVTEDSIVPSIYCNDGIPMYVTLECNKTRIARFNLVEMPGCCGICVSFQSFVYPAFRGKGLGSLLNAMRKDIARASGYSIMIATDVSTNAVQEKVFDKNGWHKKDSFLNARTGNIVNVYTVLLA